MTVVFFSDLHMGSPHVGKAYVERLVKRINDEKADLILIGGDLMINGVLGGTRTPIEKIAPLLKKLKARLGVFAVLGNHDWWNDGPNARSVLEQNGITVLNNEAKKITAGSNQSFWLIGIGDDYTKHADLTEAFSQVDSTTSTLVFMHDPGALLDAKRQFDIALAGHLHGGQIAIPGYGPLLTAGRAPREWAGGWNETTFGTVFVTKGIGTSIIPLRFGAPPEYVVLKLSSAL